MQSSFLETKHKEDKFLALDIGTEAVKILLFSTQARDKSDKNSDRKITILGSSTQYFVRYGVFDGKDFESDVMKRAISKGIEETCRNFGLFSEKEGVKREEEQKNLPVLLELPPNILKGRIISKFFKREKFQEEISKNEQEIIRAQMVNETQKEISRKFTEKFGILSEEIEWISVKFLGMKIDGYSVSKLQGYKGKNIEFKILATFLLKNYFEDINKVIKELGLKVLKIVYLAENLPREEQVLKNIKKDCIFLDIGGEITQIFSVRDGSLEQISEFQSGGRIFSRELSEILGIDDEAARILKERYSDKLLSGEAAERIKEILQQDKRDWYMSLKSELGKMKFATSNVFLFGGGALLPEIQESLEEKTMDDPQDLIVKIIYPKDLKNINNKTKSLNSPQNIPSLLMTLWQKNFTI